MQKQVTGSDYRLAGFLCLTGLSLKLLLSDPLLNSLGFHYSGEQGQFYEKIHPGTLLILFSFLVLLVRDGRVFAHMAALYRDYTAPVCLLFMCTASLLYMVLRDGVHGLTFILETHITAVLCAIVFSHAPPPLCDKAVKLFTAFAIINAAAGIAESLGQFRIFTFPSAWPVLQEQYFRASAFMGHPLDNAMFTAIMLFVALAYDYSKLQKILILFILVAGLVAFGGRAALAVSLTGLIFVSAVAIYSRRMTLAGSFVTAGAAIALPLAFIALLYIAAGNGFGQRVEESLQWDASADTRRLAFTAFSYMNAEEIWLGVSPERIEDIVYRMNLEVPLSDIENPWIMMMMSLGAALFPFWLIATLTFFYSLGKDKPLMLILAVWAYVLIATTSNSFGRKDVNYALLAGAVVCAARGLNRSR